MTPQSPREKAIYSWDSAVLNLKSSVTQYSFQSSLLFNHLNAEDEKTLDIPLEDALVHIDMQLHEIAHVQEQLHKSKIRMQSYRNNSTRLVPIHRLPAEILLHIMNVGLEDDFELKCRHQHYLEAENIQLAMGSNCESVPTRNGGEIGDDWDELDEVSETHHDFELYQYKEPAHFPSLCSQVCRKWRKLSIAKASFWTQIIPRQDPEYLQEMIHRSKTLPIDIQMNFRAVISVVETGQLEFISQHASRIRSFEYTSDSANENLEDFLRCLVPEVEAPAYNLHAIALTSEESRMGGGMLINMESVVEGVDPSIVDNLFGGIRELKLSGVYLPWGGTTFRNLTSLKLDFIDNTIAPSGDQVYAALSGSPELQSLECNEVMMFEPSPRPRRHPIYLSQLRTFKLTQSPNMLRSFSSLLFSVILAPNIAKFSLEGIWGVDRSLRIFLGFPDGSTNSDETNLFPDVVYLRLSNCRIDNVLLRQIIISMPNAEDIGLRNMQEVGIALLQYMTLRYPYHPTSPFLQKLKILRLIGCTDLNFPDVQSLVFHRNEAVGSEQAIEKLVIKWCGFQICPSRKAWFEKRVHKFVYRNYPLDWGFYDSDDEMDSDDDGGVVPMDDEQESTGNDEQDSEI